MLLARSDADLIFLGEDKVNESLLSGEYTDVSIIDAAPIDCRLVLAGAKSTLRGTPTSLGKRELLTVATSYPFTLGDFAIKQNLNLAVTYAPVGGCEAYASTARSDLVFDIKKSGATLDAQDLVVYRTAGELSLFAIDSLTKPARSCTRLERGLAEIEATLLRRVRQARRQQDVTSYTIELLRDQNKLTKKLGEEFAEFLQAMYRRPVSKDELILESADLLYVLQLVLASNGTGLTDVLNEDIRRNQSSSINDNE